MIPSNFATNGYTTFIVIGDERDSNEIYFTDTQDEVEIAARALGYADQDEANVYECPTEDLS